MGTLIHPGRAHAFDATDGEYGDYYCGPEWLLKTRAEDRIVLRNAVKDVIEQFHVPHLRAVLGWDVAQRIYNHDQTTPDVKKGEDFEACMPSFGILPENLRKHPEYVKCAQLVDEKRGKNRYYGYAVANGLSHLMPPTVVYPSGFIPAEIPFESEISWAKWDLEKKGGIASVMKFHLNDPERMEKLRRYISQSSDSWQFQQNVPNAVMRSPHFKITHTREIERHVVPISIVDPVTNHHIGSYLPEDAYEASVEFIMPVLHQLVRDGLFGCYFNADVLCVEDTGEMWNNENNFRNGGSQLPYELKKLLGHLVAIYMREEKVRASLSVGEVYEIVTSLDGQVVFPGPLAHPDPLKRRVGIYFGGKTFNEVEARLNEAKRLINPL